MSRRYILIIINFHKISFCAHNVARKVLLSELVSWERCGNRFEFKSRLRLAEYSRRLRPQGGLGKELLREDVAARRKKKC